MKTSDWLATKLAIFTGLLTSVAYMLYNVGILFGDTHPNVSSWFVWAFITVLNFTSYQSMTGDWVKSLLPTTNSIMCILTALLALPVGSFRSLEQIDIVCFVIGVIAGLLWITSKRSAVAQIILNIAIAVGGIPTIVGMINGTHREPWLPWLIWSVTYVLQYLVVKFRSGKGLDFLYAINCIVMHSAVFVLALT